MFLIFPWKYQQFEFMSFAGRPLQSFAGAAVQNALSPGRTTLSSE